MYYKTIIKGKLDFGKEKTFEKVRKMADSKFEGLYRTEIAFVNEEVFFEEENSFFIPRTVYNLTEKVWKNTINLVEYLAQFAVVGRIYAWVIQDGQMIVKKTIEPNSEKLIVQRYIKASKMMEEGDDVSALESFDKVIDKYEKHSLAYEKRGMINFRLKNYDDALYDFNKSIKLFTQNGTAYFGKALTCLKLGKKTEAIQALEETVKKTIPHQGVYWKARKMKGELTFELGEFEHAQKEFSLITKRKFDKEDPNYQTLKYAFYMLGKSLFELERYGEACNALDRALETDSSETFVSDEVILVLKGKILKEIGDENYINEWKKAKKLGCKQAASLLEAE